MAITITDQPYPITPGNQKLVVVATSDNISEDGFKFKVTLTVGLPTVTVYQGYIAPNPDGVLIYNYKGLIGFRLVEIVDATSIHAMLAPTPEPFSTSCGNYSAVVEIQEAWLVAGVLTDDPNEDGGADSGALVHWPALYQSSDGYKPNPATRYALNGTSKGWLSDRSWNTHKPPAKFGQSQATNKVFIPVRETDYGLLSMIRGLTGDTATAVNITIFDSVGAPHTWTVAIDPDIYVVHFPVFPANLNATSEMGWLHPSAYPGWRYIQVRAQDDDDSVASVNYILYNTAVYGSCEKHDPVRVAWQNSRGGWDYFNFTRKNEVSNSIDKKRYRAVIGNYGEVFSMTGMERGLTELDPIVEQSITVNSSPISENEFVFLRGLMVSKQVMIVNDNGTHTPVVVDTKTWTEIRDRKSTLKYAQVVLQYSQDYNA